MYNQNFPYQSEDWYTISNPGAINSITSSHDEIYFCTNNGIFSYHLEDKSFFFEEDYIRQFDSKKSILIHYDKYRDYLWYLNEDYLYYKPRSSSFWREIDFYDLNIFSYRSIVNIGSDHNNIYVNLGNSIAFLDPITGKLIKSHYHEFDGFKDIDNIKWSSFYNVFSIDVDLTKYHSFDGYNIISNNRIENNGRTNYITTIFEDRYNDYWIGTDTGEIFLCDSKMKIIKKIDSIPLISNINMSFLDQYGEWWMSTNNTVMINDKSMFYNYPIFLSHWIEENNSWNNYTKNEYSYIESKDITSFYRLDNWLYIGTTKGLLIFDLNQNKWELIDESNGLNSDLVYDVIYFKNNIYIANSMGINVISSISNININRLEFLEFDNYAVYDLNISDDNHLVLASEIGVYKWCEQHCDIDRPISIANRESESYLSSFEKLIDGKHMSINIDNNGDYIAGKKNRLYKISQEKELILTESKIKDVCLCNEFLWVNSVHSAKNINLKNNKIFEYSQNDGIIGERINHIGCDDSWVWFSTNRGLSIYNWSKYHFNEE